MCLGKSKQRSTQNEMQRHDEPSAGSGAQRSQLPNAASCAPTFDLSLVHGSEEQRLSGGVGAEQSLTLVRLQNEISVLQQETITELNAENAHTDTSAKRVSMQTPPIDVVDCTSILRHNEVNSSTNRCGACAALRSFAAALRQR